MIPTDLSRYSIEQLLNETSEKWKSHVKDIQSLTSAVQKILSASLSEEQRHTLHIELGELSEAFALLQKQADHPELVLATNGDDKFWEEHVSEFSDWRTSSSCCSSGDECWACESKAWL